MDTKTAKEEALALLALDYETLSYEQAERLNYLTATAAGMKTFYDHDNQFSEFTASREWVRTGYYDPDNNNLAHELPEYTTSVDACLTLPLPDCLWIIYAKAEPCVMVHRLANGDSVACAALKTLPLTMLHAWWQIQPE